MAVTMQTGNASGLSHLQLENIRCSNMFTEENMQKTFEKIKAFAIGVFQGVIIASVVISIAFLIGFGFSKGAEKAAEMFNKTMRT